MIEGPHEKIRQDIIFGEDTEESLLEGACAQKNVKDDTVVGEYADCVLCVRSDDADVALLHGNLLSGDPVGTGSLHDAYDFQKIMGMPDGGQIAQVAVQFHVVPGTEEAVFLQSIQEKSGKAVLSARMGDGFFQERLCLRQLADGLWM